MALKLTLPHYKGRTQKDISNFLFNIENMQYEPLMKRDRQTSVGVGKVQ